MTQRAPPALLRAVDSHAAITNDFVRDTFRGQGSEPSVISPDEFTQVQKQDVEQTMKVALDMGIPKE